MSTKTQPSSSRASPCTARIEQKSSQGKAEASVSISTTRGVMKETYTIKSFCSPDLEFHTLLCRPFWLPREFTAIIITAVYIPPQANTDQALRELYGNISEQETAHPDATFVVTGDLNKANFRTIAPKYLPSTRVVIVYWTTATLPSGTPTNPYRWKVPCHVQQRQLLK